MYIAHLVMMSDAVLHDKGGEADEKGRQRGVLREARDFDHDKMIRAC